MLAVRYCCTVAGWDRNRIVCIKAQQGSKIRVENASVTPQHAEMRRKRNTFHITDNTTPLIFNASSTEGTYTFTAIRTSN